MVWRQSGFHNKPIGLGRCQALLVRAGSIAWVACAALGVFIASPAVAFDDRYDDDHIGVERITDDEAVLGTFHLRARDRAHEDRRPSRTLSTADLLHMFADARVALKEGDRDEARYLFERVIAARPDSELADAARKDLTALSGTADARARSPSVQARARRASPRSRAVYGPKRPPGASALSHRPDRKQPSRRLVMLERQFIADVGDRIFFAKDSAQLDARARAVLVAQADWLKAHPDIVITIEGHADDSVETVSGPHNLSLARAEAVRQTLTDEGIGAARIASVGRGTGEPVAMCSNAGCAAQNRRVVTVISSEPIRLVGDKDARYDDGRGVSGDDRQRNDGRFRDGFGRDRDATSSIRHRRP